MKKIIRLYVGAGMFALIVGGFFSSVVGSQPVSAAANCDGNNAFLTFPAWYRGMAEPANANGVETCDIKSPAQVADESGSTEGDIAPFIWKIVGNVTEIALQLMAYIAGIFVIYGGFMYMTSAGSADQAAKALKTIINALIGIAIAVGSVAIVNLILQATGLNNASDGVNDFGVIEREAVDIIGPLLSAVYWIAGVVSVIVIVLAGMSYATSGGDAGKVAKAKNSILYGVIGLVIVIMAFVITNFIIGRIGG